MVNIVGTQWGCENGNTAGKMSEQNKRSLSRQIVYPAHGNQVEWIRKLSYNVAFWTVFLLSVPALLRLIELSHKALLPSAMTKTIVQYYPGYVCMYVLTGLKDCRPRPSKYWNKICWPPNKAYRSWRVDCSLGRTSGRDLEKETHH